MVIFLPWFISHRINSKSLNFLNNNLNLNPNLIRPLTSFRFFFALIVFVGHLKFSHNSFLIWLSKNFFPEGEVGVTFFFILSGFILAFNYQNKIQQKEITIKQFWVARFARIYPMYLVSFLIVLPLSMPGLISGRYQLLEWTSKFLSNIFMLQSFIPHRSYYFAFNVPAWSISDEMFFYLLFPALIYFLIKRKRVKGIWIILILVPFAMLLVPKPFQYFIFYINPFVRLADFLIGILLFQIYDKGIFLFKNRAFANWMECSSVILFILFCTNYNKIPMLFRYSCYYWIPMAMMIYSFAFQRGFLSRLLSYKFFVYLGEISFSFYIIHHLIIRYMYEWNRDYLFLSNDLLISALIFILVLLASGLSYKWIERPCNIYIRKRVDLSFIFSRPGHGS